MTLRCLCCVAVKLSLVCSSLSEMESPPISVISTPLPGRLLRWPFGGGGGLNLGKGGDP